MKWGVQTAEMNLQSRS
ncbi:hypothetical protein [uncultured Robinsoniella sp.]